jgi:Flp pilus assembly protein TadB
MTEPNGIDMKLRAAILLPTLIIGLALILVDVFVADFMPSWLPALFILPATISLIVIERQRSRRSSR